MALPPAQTYSLTYTTGEARSATDPKDQSNLIKNKDFQINLYKYLDRGGTTYPDVALNKGLEHDFIADQAIKSRNLYINAGNGFFKASGQQQLTTFNPTFISDPITVVVPLDNMKVEIIGFVNSLVTAGSSMSEISVFVERFTNSGTPTAGNGTEINTTNAERTTARDGYTGSYVISNMTIPVTDTVATAGTYRYYFTVQEGQSLNIRYINSAKCKYIYKLYNGYATS